MITNLKIRVAIIVVAFLGSLWYLRDTVRFYFFTSPQEEARLAVEEPQRLASLKEGALKLGLDLQGGMHLVMELDESRARIPEEEAKDAVDRALQILRNRIDQFGVSEPLIQKVGDRRIIVELPGVEDEERAKALIERTAFLEFQLLEPRDRLATILRALDEALGERQAELGEGGAAEGAPGQAQGRGVLEGLLGEREAEADSLRRPFSSLLVEFPGREAGGMVWVSEADLPRVRTLLENPTVQEANPADVEFLWGDRTRFSRGIEYHPLYLVKKEPEMTGEAIADARATIQQVGVGVGPVVRLDLTGPGGDRFERVTGAHVGENLGIVLDEVVKSSPVIRGRIPAGQGAVIEGIPDIEEARDLAIVLRAGALPAPLKIIEERTVGPSLGADSIRQGRAALLVGMVLVLVFMIIYYRLGGVVANLALVSALLIILAALAGLRATLTLPGIAGLILTVGMAVDANVLIFERIREELDSGKTIRAAIDAGYDRAFQAILDANVTTLITALVLFQFGTGPIKGFATTLSIGIVASMFTAIFMTKTVFYLYTRRRALDRLAI